MLSLVHTGALLLVWLGVIAGVAISCRWISVTAAARGVDPQTSKRLATTAFSMTSGAAATACLVAAGWAWWPHVIVGAAIAYLLGVGLATTPTTSHSQDRSQARAPVLGNVSRLPRQVVSADINREEISAWAEPG